MKFFINRDAFEGPYGGGNLFVKAFLTLASKLDVTVGTRLNQRYDAILLMDPRPDEQNPVGIKEVMTYKIMFPKVKIFQRVNECDARKQTQGVDPMLHSCGQVNDFTFFVSDWMRDYHLKRGWPCKNHQVIYNGVDRSIYSPKLPALKDAAVTHIVTHHWSDNPYKGQDVHTWLDGFVSRNKEQFTYTYIGRHETPLPNTKMIEPLHGKALGDELKKYDIYVTGTVCDPGPNHVIEAIACGLPTYAHSRGGGAVEFVGPEHAYDNEVKLEEFLRATKHEPNKWVPPSWEECVLQYVNKMKEVVSG
jgi:hypothetical protein